VRRALILFVVVAAAARADATRAAQPTAVLVELFTSEGCSDCPPADVVLARLVAEQPIAGAEVIALGEHVDYWDRLGWKDRFSSAALTNRQQVYAARFNLDSVYTPQMVVDGRAQFVGSDGHAARTDIPVRVTSTRFAALASRQSSFCGNTSDGDVRCWPVGASFPVATTGYAVKLVTLTGSYGHVCGLTSSGDAYCWGANEHGQLGTGDTVAQSAPTHAVTSLKFTKISAGFARTCAIATDRHAYCTGGTVWTWTPQPDDSLNSTRFVRVQGNDEFTSVTVGGGIACGVTTTGEGKCWGSNNNKQLGTGSVSGTTATPHTVDGAHRFRDIIAGAYHACGITVEGEMYCWGFDHSGQLGSLGFPDTCTLSDEFYACTGTPVLVPKPQ